MAFIRTFLGKSSEEGITLVDLEAFVARRIPESLNLEYKSKDALREPAKVACEVAAFANSDGGLLVIGVEETKERAARLPDKVGWDQDRKHTHEWLEAVVVLSVHPPVRDVRIVQVRNAEGALVHLVEVPASPSPPHMAPDGKYYYRTSSSARPMEHYQVADAFGKRRRPVLRPAVYVSEFDAAKRSVRLRYSLFNEGHALAKWVFVQLSFVGCDVEEKSGRGVWEHVRRQRGEDGMDECLVTNESPIAVLHPGLVSSYEPFRVKMSLPLALLIVLVGAEDAPTETYAALLGEQWLLERTAENPAKEIVLPLLASEEAEEERVAAWQQQFAADFGALDQPSGGKIGVRLLLALGTKFLETVLAEAVKELKASDAASSGHMDKEGGP